MNETSSQKIVSSYFSSLLKKQLTTLIINKAVIHDLSNLMKRFFGTSENNFVSEGLLKERIGIPCKACVQIPCGFLSSQR